MQSFAALPFIFIIGFIVLGVCYLFAKRSTRPLAKQVKYLLFLSSLIFLCRFIMLMIPAGHVAGLAYSCYELFRIWMCFVIASFMLALSGHTFDGTARTVFFGFAVLDTISFVVNGYTGHLFEIATAQSGTGVFSVTYGRFYFTHIMLMYGFLLYIIYQGVRKLSHTYSAYWFKYIVTMGVAFAIILATILGSHFPGGAFWVDIVYFFMSVLAFFETQVFRSKMVHTYEYSEALDSITQHFILFDNEGDCVLVNSGAREFFELDAFDLSHVREQFNDIVDYAALVNETEAEQNCTFVKGGETRFLRLNYKKIYHHGRFSGEAFGFTDITTEMKELEVERRLARYDSFTKVYNGEWLFKSIEDRINANPDTEYYIIGSDIRDFKVFNDVFGKDAGDAVIQRSADILRSLYNDGAIEIFGRIYADRFGMFVKKEAFSENAIVNSFLTIDHPFKEEYYHLNIHFGVYRTLMDPGLPVKSMFDRAFVALDTIKNEVNVRIYHYNEIMRDEKIWEQTISTNIEKAIKEGQLRIVVQPQVDRNENVIGGEALVRWRHPENGEISPGNFIPVLEKTGLVTNADIYVWEEACKLLRRWKDLGYTQYYISVNISATDFMFTDIYSIFTNLVTKYDINPKNLKLEITETAMMTDVLERIVLIKRLEEYGFSVELDDFGSGYSSLNMLKEIPVDVIKMDMKFLYNYDNESTQNSHKIIGHIIQMAKDLNMEIVAEGVETREQLGFLQDAGCDVFQGYLFSKPVEVADFEKNQGIA